MRQFLIIAAATGGLSFSVSATPAMAGYCGNNIQPVTCQRPIAPPPAPPCVNFVPPMSAPPAPVPNCQPPVVVHPGAPYSVDPVVISNSQPMGYLRTIKFRNSPHVNITRVHGQSSGISLHDAPTGFTPGCHPSSTTYCGLKTVAAAVPAPSPAPAAAPQHIIQYEPYIAQPFIAPPLVVQPRPMPVTTVEHQSHQYGSTGLVRGTAYLPTSHVNRDYQTAVNVLNSGPIPARPAVNGGEVPHPSMFGHSGYVHHQMNTHTSSGTMHAAPAPMPMSIAPPVQHSGPAYGPNFGPGAGQWEQVSGPTMVGGLHATQVICRKASPMPAPVTCTRQAAHNPLALAGVPQAPMGNSRYGSNY